MYLVAGHLDCDLPEMWNNLDPGDRLEHCQWSPGNFRTVRVQSDYIQLCSDRKDRGGVSVHQVHRKIDEEIIIKPILARSPFVDSPMIFPAVTAEEFYTKMEEMPSPRIIKVYSDHGTLLSLQ